MNPLFQQMNSWGHPRLLVVGDLMLDRYTSGDAERVSPEAPVLVLRADAEEIRLGGAASVAALLRGLEAEVSLAGVIGMDASGRLIRTLLREDLIDDSLVLCESDRRTTTKERFLGRSARTTSHQMLRVDHEDRHEIRAETQERMLQMILERLPQFKAILISDYAKGVCTSGVLHPLIDAARQHNIPVLVDPGRGLNYERYRGSSVVKPNRLEAQEAAGVQIHTPQEAIEAGKMLCTKHGLDAVVVTLDREGMVIYSADGTAEAYPTNVRQVCDITGAGDMVLAAVGLGIAQGVSLYDAARIANFAAGMEVERQGVAVVTRQELVDAGIRESFVTAAESSTADWNLSSPRNGSSGFLDSKLVNLEDAARIAARQRRSGRTVVLTNGCFDLLHVGHVTYLQEAARLGDILIVAVNSDSSVRRSKGSGRPVIPQHERVAMLAALSCVGHVMIFDEDAPHRLLQAIRPDLLVKGGTYSVDEVIGREIVESYGGRVLVLCQVPGRSTTQIVSSIRSL